MALVLPQTAKKLDIADSDFVAGEYLIDQSKWNTYFFSITADYDVILENVDPNILLTLKIVSNPGSNTLSIYSNAVLLTTITGTQIVTFINDTLYLKMPTIAGSVSSIQPTGALVGTPTTITTIGTLDMVALHAGTTTISPVSSLSYDQYGRITTSISNALSYLYGLYSGATTDTGGSFVILPMAGSFSPQNNSSDFSYVSGSSHILYSGVAKQMRLFLSVVVILPALTGTAVNNNFRFAINGIQFPPIIYTRFPLLASAVDFSTGGAIEVIRNMAPGDLITVYFACDDNPVTIQSLEVSIAEF